MNAQNRSLTNYERVARFNHIAGNAFGNGWHRLKKQRDIIQKERNEVDKAFDEKDVKGMIDGWCDELVTVYGGLYILGVNGDDAMSEVLDALETRFDTTMEDAEKTVEKYKALDVETHIYTCVHEGVNYFVVKSTIDQVGNNGEEYTEGKWLKSYKFREPDLQKFIYAEMLDRLELTIPV